MKNKIKILILFLTLMLIGFAAILFKNPTSALASFFREIKPQPLSQANPISLIETWSVVEKFINEKDPELQILELVSIDHPDDHLEKNIQGENGKRRAWMVMLENIEKNQLTRLTIWDGGIIEQINQYLDYELPGLERPILDSMEAYQTAIGYSPWIQPNSNHGRGIHFAYRMGEDKNSALMVIGGKKGEALTNEALVMINPLSGKVEKVVKRSFANAGGILYSEDGGLTWHASNLTKTMTNGVTKDLTSQSIGYAVTTNEIQITVFETQDGGKTWTELSKLPTSAGGWPTSITMVPSSWLNNNAKDPVVFITTHTGVWQSLDTVTWTQVPSLPSIPYQWSTIMKTKDGIRIFVSGSQLFTSDNLLDWNQFGQDGWYRLSPSFDHTQVIVTNQNLEESWLFTDKDQRLINLPLETMDAAGDFNRLEHIIVRKNGSVSIVSTQKPSNFIMDIASLSASPNFLEDGILISGGFRTGLFLSKDFGVTWENVIPNPSEIVTGSNEISEILYFSEKSIIAINGGYLTWEDLP
jgi:hypothetical protein